MFPIGSRIHLLWGTDMMRIVYLSALVAVFSCGGDEESNPGSDVTSSPHYQRCNNACDFSESDRCDSADETSCTEECVVNAEGFSSLCAACIADHTGLFTCNGEPDGEGGFSCGCNWDVASPVDSNCISVCD